MSDRFKRQLTESSSIEVVGLKSREEFRAAQETATKRRDLAAVEHDEELTAEERERKRRKTEKRHKKKIKEQKKTRVLLSFGDDEDEEGDETPSEAGARQRANATETNGPGAPAERQSATTCEASELKVVKNADVNTSFLPDREREERVRDMVNKLKREWIEEQDRIKNEEVTIIFSYWDGSGHRRSIKVSKGTTIERFLEAVRAMLVKEFPQLRSASSDTLMFIKEDLIIPHEATFYDLIASRARGKSGPLFSFGVQDDVRLVNDVRQETEHTHAGKIVERHWFERNRHIYPASRWELLDITQVYSDIAKLAEQKEQSMRDRATATTNEDLAGRLLLNGRCEGSSAPAEVGATQ